MGYACDFLPRRAVWKVRLKGYFIVEKSNKYALSQVLKINIDSDVMSIIYNPETI